MKGILTKVLILINKLSCINSKIGQFNPFKKRGIILESNFPWLNQVHVKIELGECSQHLPKRTGV